MGAALQALRLQAGLEHAHTVSPNVIALIGRLGVFAAVGHIVFRRFAQAVIMPRKNFACAQVEDVTMPAVPVVKIRTILQAIGIETAILLVKTANRVGARQKTARTSGHQAMIPGDVARFDLPV